MSNAVRELVFKTNVRENQPMTMPQNVTIEMVTEHLRKFYAKIMRDEMFIAVRSRHDPVSGKVNHRVFDVYNYKNYPGAAYAKFEMLVQKHANELFHILNVALRFHLVVNIEPDTRNIYMHHKDRPLEVIFWALPKV